VVFKVFVRHYSAYSGHILYKSPQPTQILRFYVAVNQLIGQYGHRDAAVVPPEIEEKIGLDNLRLPRWFLCKCFSIEIVQSGSFDKRRKICKFPETMLECLQLCELGGLDVLQELRQRNG
jgi:hypothetical protein